MKMYLRLLLVTILLITLLAGIPLASQEDNRPEPVGLRPDAPTYALHGPYWVGTQQFTVEIEGEPLDLYVWYPALNPEGVEPTINYEFYWQLAEGTWGYTYDQLYVQIQGHAIADAQPDMSGGAYPLVVFSHGWISSPVIQPWLVEHIVSYGFVVVAPHHIEFRDEASSDMGRALIVRHRPIVAALDYAEVLTASDGALAGMIDMDKVAVAGISYGGWTALVMAGARWDLVAYEEACRLDSIRNFSCPILSEEQMATMLALEGLDAPPEGLWPSRFDPRIDVAISLAGDSDTFGERGLAEITIPMLVIGGTADTGTYYENSVRTYNAISSTQKILAGFENAEHFAWAPDVKDVLVYDPSTYYAFSDPVWDMARIHDLGNHLIVAFLFSTLLGDEDATAMLAPDAVNFVGVTYEAEGF